MHEVADMLDVLFIIHLEGMNIMLGGVMCDWLVIELDQLAYFWISSIRIYIELD